MSAEDFRNWRKELGLKQKDAADLLGLKKRMIQYYEKGARDGKPVEIPKTVRLACYALTCGVVDFDGTQQIVPGDAEASDVADKMTLAEDSDQVNVGIPANDDAQAEAAGNGAAQESDGNDDGKAH